MNLGASGVLNLMNSLGGLQSVGKYWTAGDRVLLAFPVTGEDDNGNPIIPVSFRYGHNIDLGTDSKFKRSFVPTTSEMNLTTGEPLEHDFAYRVANLMSAILKGERARAEERITKDPSLNEASKKIELEGIEENFKNRRAAISFLKVRAYTEVLVAKLGADFEFTSGKPEMNYANMNLSKKKLGQLLEEAKKAYKPGQKYVYLYMDTPAGAKKNEAGQAPLKAFEEKYLLETRYPETFAKYVTKEFSDRGPTPESIGAKVYDFKPYDERELISAVAEYVNNRTFYLKDSEGKFIEVAQNERVASALAELNLVADAEAIRLLIADTTETDEGAMVAELSGEAQQLDLEGITGSALQTN